MIARDAGWLRYVWTAALVALASGVAYLGRGYVDSADVVMVYLLAIVAAAVFWGRGPSIFGSALSVAAYNLIFVPPYFTFSVSDDRHVLTFAVLFGVGILISELTLRMRRHALRARTEELRSSLLSAVSHDLRTPLAAITGAATTLRDGSVDLTAEQRGELVDTICEEAERLERLVVNLLDMTRLESGSMLVKREWVPVEEVLGSALTRMETRLAGRTVCTELPADLPLISVDPVLLGQVFVNLLENAIKYTPADTPIEIAARPKGGGVEIDVADRGPGLPAGAESRVFEKFFRGAHAVSGVGLGLAICRGIVAAHGGTLVAENRPGGGALFRLALPVGGSAPALPAPEASGQDVPA